MTFNQPRASVEFGERVPARAADVIVRSLGESAIVIRLSTSRIYELNGTGARVWDLLDRGLTRDDIISTLEREFEIGTTNVSNAVDELLAALHAEGLMDRARLT